MVHLRRSGGASVQDQDLQELSPKKVDTKNCDQVRRVIGGVERNPGPQTVNTQAELDKIGQKNNGDPVHNQDPLTVQTPTKQDYPNTKRPRVVSPLDEPGKQKDKIDILCEAMRRVEEKLDKSLLDSEEEKIRIDQLEAQNTQLTQTVNQLEKEVHILKTKVIDNENRSREANLIFFGLNTNTNMKADECWDTITNFLKQDLHLENLYIDRAHTLGMSSKPPIIAKFPRSYDRKFFFERVHMLRNSPVSIAQDFAQETRDARRELNNFRKIHALPGERTKLIKDMLFMQNGTYVVKDGKVEKKDSNRRNGTREIRTKPRTDSEEISTQRSDSLTQRQNLPIA